MLGFGFALISEHNCSAVAISTVGRGEQFWAESQGFQRISLMIGSEAYGALHPRETRSSVDPVLRENGQELLTG